MIINCNLLIKQSKCYIVKLPVLITLKHNFIFALINISSNFIDLMGSSLFTIAEQLVTPIFAEQINGLFSLWYGPPSWKSEITIEHYSQSSH